MRGQQKGTGITEAGSERKLLSLRIEASRYIVDNNYLDKTIPWEEYKQHFFYRIHNIVNK